jgi:hypothetical protein
MTTQYLWDLASARYDFNRREHVGLFTGVFHSDLELVLEHFGPRFRVICLAWNDPGNWNRDRHSWMISGNTKKHFDEMFDKGKNIILLVLMVTPQFTPMYAVQYDPRITSIAQNKGGDRYNIMAKWLLRDSKADDGREWKPDIITLSPEPWRHS